MAHESEALTYSKRPEDETAWGMEIDLLYTVYTGCGHVRKAVALAVHSLQHLKPARSSPVRADVQYICLYITLAKVSSPKRLSRL